MVKLNIDIKPKFANSGNKTHPLNQILKIFLASTSDCITKSKCSFSMEALTFIRSLAVLGGTAGGKTGNTKISLF